MTVRVRKNRVNPVNEFIGHVTTRRETATMTHQDPAAAPVPVERPTRYELVINLKTCEGAWSSSPCKFPPTK